MASIYIISNSVNNKVYIGQTVSDINFRFRKHKAQRNCKNVCSALYSAFKKYGTDKFKVESLTSGDYSKIELNALEIFYIKEYNSLSPNGYNLQSGGGSFRVAESVKRKTSEKLKGRNITWGGKVSEGLKARWADPEYREAQTLQRYEKRGKYREGIIKPFRLNIDLLQVGRMHQNGDTIYKIAKHFNCSFGAIKKRIELWESMF